MDTMIDTLNILQNNLGEGPLVKVQIRLAMDLYLLKLGDGYLGFHFINLSKFKTSNYKTLKVSD